MSSFPQDASRPIPVSCPISSSPKTWRESAPCCDANPHKVFDLVPVGALSDADFAGFPDGDPYVQPLRQSRPGSIDR
jgi:hypothetical protein